MKLSRKYAPLISLCLALASCSNAAVNTTLSDSDFWVCAIGDDHGGSFVFNANKTGMASFFGVTFPTTWSLDGDTLQIIYKDIVLYYFSNVLLDYDYVAPGYTLSALSPDGDVECMNFNFTEE